MQDEQNQDPRDPRSRRSFLKWGAAVGAAFGAAGLAGQAFRPGTLWAADAPAPPAAPTGDASAPAAASPAHSLAEYGGLPMGLQSYTLRSMSFDKMLETMSNELKLYRVELYGGHLAHNAPPPKIAAAKQKLQETGVTAVGYGVVGFDKDYNKGKAIFEFAKLMGLKSISADPSPDSFDTLDKLVEEYQIPIAIHDHGPGHRWGKIAAIQNAIKDHNKLIGLCNDTGHFIRAGEDPLEACHVFKDRLYGMHLKDFKQTGPGKWEDVILGDGSLKVEPIIKFLLDMNFAGVLSIEYEGAKPVEATQTSLQRLREAVKTAKSA